ncbi:MAG: peptidylprolyl isomerase [Gemmatimonadales bacterium]|jgi:peptidyl-prolyl cis-trans isomerase SurA
MVQQVARELVTAGGWRIVATVALIGAAVACSGGAPPETGPSTGRTDEPTEAAADRGEVEQPEEQVAEPELAPPKKDAPSPGAEARPETTVPSGQPSDPGVGAAPPANPSQTSRDLFSGSGLSTVGGDDQPGNVGDLFEDPAAAEQGPGFGLPPDPVAPPPRAATPPSVDSLELVDRIVAIVGDTAILMSEVREKVFQMRAQGMEMPTDPAGQDSLALATLEGMVEELMIVKQAEFAGITVTEEELDDEVDRRFETIRSRFSSDEEMLQRVEDSGQNMFQFRRMIRSQARKDMIGQRYISSQMGEMLSVRVTEQQIVDEFNARAAGATRPATLDLVQVTIDPEPSEAARDSALKEASTARDEVREGEDFEIVARRYSDDVGTRAEGGDLGWIRRSEVDPAFGDAAWAVRTGIAIGPVQSRFGFHIIKVENVRGGERHVRHILIRPYISPEQIEEARLLAAAVADSIRDGADATVMAERYGTDPEDSRIDDARVDRISGALGAEFAEALRGAQTGDVVGPIEVVGAGGDPSFIVIEVMRYRPEGVYELDEVRDQIRDALMQQGQYEALLERLKQEVYVRMLI